MARLLSGQKTYGVPGRTAEALLYTLMNNQTEALDKVSRLEKESVQIQPWIRALRVRNTRDYRLLGLNTNSPLVEVVAWSAAYSGFMDSDGALKKAWELAGPAQPDFCRIVNSGHYSVGAGHQLLRTSIPLEMKEIEDVYTASHGKQLQKDDFVHELNCMPERCLSATKDGSTVRVIGWGQWALFLQKHLCHAMHQNFHFMNDKWGVPDDAKEFATKCENMFSDLRLFPFVRRLFCTDSKSYHRAIDDGFVVTVKTPQIVPAEMWNHLCYKGPNKELYHPNPNPHVNEWHYHNPPPGTAYNIDPRRGHPSITSKPTAVSQLEEMHASAPYDYELSFFLLDQKFRDSETYEQAEAVYRPISDYSVWAMDRLSRKANKNPELYEKITLRAANLDPDRYLSLGKYFSAMDEQKAVRYFEKGIELSSDSVAKSYVAPWLVKYYLLHGQRAKASDLADFAEEVYSYEGLRAKAEYLELVGRFKEAMNVYLKMRERYGNCDELPAFAYRQRDKKTLGTERYWKAEVSKLFPAGLESITIEQLKGKPTQGVILGAQSNAARAVGLEKGDIIVAVEGVRIQNIPQCIFAESLKLDPEIEFIAWKANHYQKLQGRLLERRLDSEIEDYSPRTK
jgi:tetratricopeptide (TPR) repeat protein